MIDDAPLPETTVAPRPRIQEPRPLTRPCNCGKKRVLRQPRTRPTPPLPHPTDTPPEDLR